jgi:serine/threonine protein phosphatase Stp1
MVTEDSTATALQDANAELFKRNHGKQSSMGSTVAVLGAGPNGFFCLWAGDSRIYRLHDGKLDRLTRDHRYVQDLIDSGVLDDDQAKVHPQRNVITRAIGIEATIHIDRCVGAVAHGDTFVLITDGISTICADCEIGKFAARDNLESALDDLVIRCLERGAPDNLSVVLVRAI